ncbi:MAG: SRPBCC family protein [Gemmobacter sp.]
MRKIIGAIAACLALLSGAAQAHGPSRLKTEQTVTLDATPAEVWAVIGRFDDMAWFPGTVSVQADGADKGALRTRTLDDGTVVTEELLKHDPAKFAISVRLTEDNLDLVKATTYASHITIKDVGGKAVVDWKGAFYRAFPQNDPPADQNDDASTAAVLALHQRGIDALVARFGTAE